MRGRGSKAAAHTRGPLRQAWFLLTAAARQPRSRNHRRNSSKANSCHCWSGSGPVVRTTFGRGIVARHLSAPHPRQVPNVVPQPHARLRVACWWRTGSTTPPPRMATGDRPMINRGLSLSSHFSAGKERSSMRSGINYIGSPGRDTTVCAARKDAPVQTMRDLLWGASLPVGGTGSGADTAIYPEFLSALTGHEIQAHERLPRLARDPVGDGARRGAGHLPRLRFALTRQSRAQRSYQRAAAGGARSGSADRRTCPMVLAAARSDAERQALEFVLRARPPWVVPSWRRPTCRRTGSRRCGQAFDATLRDQAFLDDARKQNLKRGSGHLATDVGRRRQGLTGRRPEIVKRTMQALGRGG